MPKTTTYRRVDEVACAECGDPLDPTEGDYQAWDGKQGRDVKVCVLCWEDVTVSDGRWPSGTACEDCGRDDQDFAPGWPHPVCAECAIDVVSPLAEDEE